MGEDGLCEDFQAMEVTDRQEEKSLTRTTTTTSASGSSCDDDDDDGDEVFLPMLQDQLVECLFDESTVLDDSIRAAVPDILLKAEQSHRLGALLSSVLCSSSIEQERTAALVRSLLEQCPEAAQYQDATGRTALHEVVDNSNKGTIQPNLVRLLVETFPAIVHVRDESGSLPIDILARVALMREERLRYSSKAEKSEPSSASAASSVAAVKNDLNKLWECSRYLILSPESFDLNIPTPHALLSANAPVSLVEQVIRHHSLAQMDHEGNLPLHVVADLRRQPAPQTTQDDDDDDDDDEAGESSLHLLRKILRQHPGAASVRNHAGWLPIDLSIASGRRWETGIALLLDAYPLAGLDRRFTLPEHYPLLFDELLNRKNRPSTVFALLKNNPKSILSINRELSSSSSSPS